MHSSSRVAAGGRPVWRQTPHPISEGAPRGRFYLRVEGICSVFRALRDSRSVERGSRRGAKGGVRIDDSKQLFYILPPMEMFAEEQPSLVLLVRSGHVREVRPGARSAAMRNGVGDSERRATICSGAGGSPAVLAIYELQRGIGCRGCFAGTPT
jgi:hypothetical protein